MAAAAALGAVALVDMSGGRRSAQEVAVAKTGARGPVTNLPLPRFVSLKGKEGNARRGPGLQNRIDWLFTRRDMPLRITGEYENWRRVEDRDGAGGWIHYTLLSGTRTVIVETDLAPLRQRPDDTAEIEARLEAGVVGRISRCTRDWCRIGAGGTSGWTRKTALWGVEPDEILE